MRRVYILFSYPVLHSDHRVADESVIRLWPYSAVVLSESGKPHRLNRLLTKGSAEQFDSQFLELALNKETIVYLF